jgi:hypothetical protein
MLPPAFRWSDTEDWSVLFLRYGAVAKVCADGTVTFSAGIPAGARAASRAQGKRFVERWIAANGVPLTRGEWAMRERLTGRGPRCAPSTTA